MMSEQPCQVSPAITPRFSRTYTPLRPAQLHEQKSDKAEAIEEGIGVAVAQYTDACYRLSSADVVFCQSTQPVRQPCPDSLPDNCERSTMKRLLTSTTALSVALATILPAPMLAQVPVQGASGTVTCLPLANVPCPDGMVCVIAPEAPCDTIDAATFAQAAAAAAAAAPNDRAAAREARRAARVADKAQADADKAALQATEKAQVDADKAAAQATEKAQADETRRAARAAARAEAAAKAAVDGAAIPAVVTAEPVPETAVDTLLEILTTPENDAGATAAAAAAAPTETGTANAPGTTETTTAITAEDTRTSAQDFAKPETTAAAPGQIGPAPTTDRLSKLEKFGLVVLGGLVVGAILKNGDRVVSNTGDRVVVERDDGSYAVMKDDDTLIRQPGSNVRTESFADGSTRATVTRTDGSRIVTIRDASGRVLRRSRIEPSGLEVVLIDDLGPVERIDVTTLPQPRAEARFIRPDATDAALRAAMFATQAREVGRSFSLRQVRDVVQVRALAPEIGVESITFETGSAAIRPSEAAKLARLGRFMSELIVVNPQEMFLIEGHTDAVGSASSNLALSDRRAESLALALTEYFGVPPENLVVQGYGEAELLVPTEAPEVANRRTAVRMISPLLERRVSR